MKVVIESTFHPGLTETFSGLNAGYNYRKVKTSCGGSCQCGWPVSHSAIDAPQGWKCAIAPMPTAGEIQIYLTKEKS